MWFHKKVTIENLGQTFARSEDHLRQLCLESLENRMAMAVDPLAAMDGVAVAKSSERAELLAGTVSAPTDGRISPGPSSSIETNELGQLFLTSRLEVTDAEGRAVTAVPENERVWVNVYHTYFQDSFPEDFKLVASKMTVVFDDPLFTQIGKVESLDIPAETAWTRRTIPDPRTGIGTLTGIEVLQYRFEVLAAPANGPRGYELYKTLQRPGSYRGIESLPVTIQRMELTPPVVTPENTPVVTPSLTQVVTPVVTVTPTVTPVVTPTVTLTPLPQIPTSESRMEPAGQALSTETGDSETIAVVSSESPVAEQAGAKKAVAQPVGADDSSLLSTENNEAPSFTQYVSVISGVVTVEFHQDFTFRSATQDATIEFSHRLDASDLLDAEGRLDDESPGEVEAVKSLEEEGDLPASEQEQSDNLPEPAPPGVIDRLLQEYLEEYPEPLPELGNVDWEVRHRSEQLLLLQLDDQAEACDAFVTLDYSHLPYELDRSIGLQRFAETDEDIYQHGLVQFQRGPLQMLSEIDDYQQQPRLDVASLGLPEAQPEALTSVLNYTGFLRETALSLLAILVLARRHVGFGMKAIGFRKRQLFNCVESVPHAR